MLQALDIYIDEKEEERVVNTGEGETSYLWCIVAADMTIYKKPQPNMKRIMIRVFTRQGGESNILH